MRRIPLRLLLFLSLLAYSHVDVQVDDAPYYFLIWWELAGELC